MQPSTGSSKTKSARSWSYSSVDTNTQWHLQTGPHLGNQYSEDAFLKATLERLLPSSVLSSITPDLTRFGDRVAHDLWPRAKTMDHAQHAPTLQQYNGWGRRIDDIKTCESWNYMHKVAAEEGLIAIGYENVHGKYDRLYQFAKLYLFGPSSGLYNCPLAMTDGAAKLCTVVLSSDANSGNEHPNFMDLPAASIGALRNAYSHLTSRDPDVFWTSGQWMTERGGGSDVARGTETRAVPTTITSDDSACDSGSDSGLYSLHGYKWFTSATDSSMSFTLARIEDDDGDVKQGTRGLSCFFVRVRKGDDNSELNNIRIHRLKNKLGTRQLPTAEMELNGTKAHLVSTRGRGVPAIVNMVNLTRLYNATAACGYMRRMVAINRDYAARRSVFGKKLQNNLLHLETIANLELQLRGSLSFTMDCIRLFGEAEHSTDPKQSKRSELLLRLLTPLVKLFTGKLVVPLVSEGLEGFGGQGYIEDTGIPQMLRDAQVLPIWEGTTNVLSMDVLRVFEKAGSTVLPLFYDAVQCRIDAAMEQTDREKKLPLLMFVASRLASKMEPIQRAISQLLEFPIAMRQLARDVSMTLSRLYVCSLLLEHATWSGEILDVWVAQQWIEGQVNGIGPIIARTISAHIKGTGVYRNALVKNLALDLANQQSYSPLHMRSAL
jgi:alkylation response protein AidB-like acyl-CoA dehydrogenase